jgi:hypothetical protein
VINFVNNLKIKRNDKSDIKISKNTETCFQVFTVVPYFVGISQENGKESHIIVHRRSKRYKTCIGAANFTNRHHAIDP